MASLDPLPYYKWLWRDWRSNRRVAKMHITARGIYRELLDEQWAEGSIPNDTEALAEICDCPLHIMNEYWPEVEPCFNVRDDGRLVNPKMERQRSEMDMKRIQHADSGRIGGKRRAANSSAVQRSLPIASSRAEQSMSREEQSRDLGSSPPPPVEVPKPDPASEAIERLFAYYCAAFNRDPKKYALTDLRRQKADARMRERIRVHLGDVAKAERDLIRAIENLTMSEFHRSQGFIDWIDQIFRSQEVFEKRLNWERPEESTNGKRSASTTKTGGTIDALAQARAFTRGRAAPGGHPDTTGEAGSPAAGAP